MRPIEVHFEKNINNLTLVREADTRRQVEYVAVAMIAALFVLGVLFYGWQRAQYLQYGYDISKAQVKQNKLELASRELRVKREQLRGSTRIEREATAMGLVGSVPGQLVPVDLDSPLNPQVPLSANK